MVGRTSTKIVCLDVVRKLPCETLKCTSVSVLSTFADMIMIGDFGVDIDDEKALCLAVPFLRIGVEHRMSVIANTGDSTMRVGLAKGTLQGNECVEFDRRYLASEDEVDPCEGHLLIDLYCTWQRLEGRAPGVHRAEQRFV